MIKLYALSTLHLIFECAHPLRNFSTSRAKVCSSSWCIFWMALFTNWGPSVISLISIGFLCVIIGSSSFWQSPSWKVLFGWRVSTSFRDISTRTNSIRSTSLVLKRTCATSSKAKGISWLFDNFWSFFRIILGTWSLLKAVYLHLIQKESYYS